MNQKVLTVTTRNESLRSEVIGWTLEDSNQVNPDQVFMSQDHIGHIRSHDIKDKFCYPTVLQALGDGWKLLGKPERVEDRRSEHGPTLVNGTKCWFAEGKRHLSDGPAVEISYYWWLVKD